jgi:hypothetical protein
VYLRPSPISARIFSPPVPRPGLDLIPSRHAALTAKVAASAPNAEALPRAPTSSPPSAGPARNRVTGRVAEGVGLDQSALGRMSGKTAEYAGWKNASAAPNTAARTTRCQTSSTPPADRNAMTPTAAPRTRSEASITARRGSRSLTAPPISSRTSIGTDRARSTMDSATGFRDSSYVCQASAIVVMPSPSNDTVWPAQSSRKSRSASGLRIRSRLSADWGTPAIVREARRGLSGASRSPPD